MVKKWIYRKQLGLLGSKFAFMNEQVLEQELIDYPEIQRIHRSYLINRLQIDSVKQTKGKVFIEILGVSLPVSKKYQEYFMD